MEQARSLLRRSHDDAIALRKLADDPEIIDATVGFHAQQACEKGLKAVLAAHGIVYPRTHRLEILHGLLVENSVDLPQDVAAMLALSPYGAQFRYDDPPEGVFDRSDATRLVSSVLAWCDAEIAAIPDEP